MIDGIESSAAASKRRRIEILNGMNGVPFTNPITQFPSMHLLQQQNRNPPQNTSITDLNLALPTPNRQQVVEQNTPVDDGLISSLIPQQNFIMNYHVNKQTLLFYIFFMHKKHNKTK